jgi:hypothetical protein
VANLFDDLHNPAGDPEALKQLQQGRYAPSVTYRCSQEARASMSQDVLTAQQDQVLTILLRFFTLGCTDEQGTAYSHMNPSSYRTRRDELATMGKVEVCGIRKTASGRNAIVWRVKA